jgi:hypothetical protein
MKLNINLTMKAILLSVLLITPVLAFAVSEAAVIFLLIEPGSRPGAMGSAYVAQVDDAFAGYWNPGAMAFNRQNQIALMHTNWLGDVPGIDDIYLEYLAWNNYFESLEGNLGFHVIYLTYGKQERRDHNNIFQGTFTSYDLAVATSYGFQYSDNLGLGLTFKFILSDLAPEGQGLTEKETKGRGISYAFDFGLKYKDIFTSGLDLGFCLQNVGPNITYINEAQTDPLPMNFRFGLSYRMLEDEYHKFTINGDFNKLLANDDWVLKRLFTAWYDDGGWQELDSTIFNIGAEFVYLNLLSLRAGYIYDKAGSIIGPSFGGGIQYRFMQRYLASFDFAMQQGGELTPYNKTFSVGFQW